MSEHSPVREQRLPVAEVAVGSALAKTLHYAVPKELSGVLRPGHIALVPLGRRLITGFVLGLLPRSPHASLKPIRELLDPEPVFSEEMLDFLRWVAHYYFHPLGGVLRTAVPAGLHRQSRKALAATPAGLAARDASLEPLRRRLLERLAEEGPCPLRGLERMGAPAEVRRVAAQLVREGLAREVHELAEGRVRPVTERRVILAPGADTQAIDPRRAPRQAGILELLAEGSPLPVSGINQALGPSSAALKTLTAKGLVRVEEVERYRNPLDGGAVEPDTPPELTPEQAAAVAAVLEGGEGYRGYLLHGVTGSGKTEVYLRVIERVLEEGRRALVLVPEISLTPQTVARFQARLQRPLAVLHSGLSPGERYDEWRRIRAGLADVVIGARSAVFAPIERLGVIVVDEEHDDSYKQEDGLRYHARDLALVRGRRAGAAVVLGSATPSLESYYNARTGKLTLLTLARRVENRSLPEVSLIDMRDSRHSSQALGHGGSFSQTMKRALEAVLDAGDQAIVFRNRRGFATFVICRDCGYHFACPHCDISLTYHRHKGALTCHYCQYTRPLPDLCPLCSGRHVDPRGAGTERVEDDLARIFPQARILRLDRDTTSRKNALAQARRRILDGEVDLILGTQLVAKGHDFPGVTLVAVLSADQALNFPDFRSSERTFQLLTQVSGRAGRGDRGGIVLVQAYNPEHYSVQRAREHDYEGFYQAESEVRRALEYPPFSRMACLRLQGRDGKATGKAAHALGECASAALAAHQCPPGGLLGPCPAPFERIQGRHRWHMLLKDETAGGLHRLVGDTLARAARAKLPPTGVRLTVDIDPQSIL